MEGNGKKESPPLLIDPKCIQDALRAFLPPIKNDDARLDFYTVYKKESTEYDTDYVKKYDEDLNTTLIFAGLFSAVSSAFVIDAQSRLLPDPNEQSAAILLAILLTLNSSAIPNQVPAFPHVQGDPPNETVTVSGLMYASLLISLLAAFVAMLGKQWLNRYLRHSGGSMIERCGDRQRKFDGLERWSFHLFVESLPVMLQVALLLLACGLCRRLASVNTSVAGVLIALTAVGVLFYLVIVVAGTSSYACPFQTPASTALRRLWAKIRPHTTPLVGPIIAGAHIFGVLSSNIWYSFWEKVVVLIRFYTHRFKRAVVRMTLNFNHWIRVTLRPRRRVRHPSPDASLRGIRESPRMPPGPNPPPHYNNPSLLSDSSEPWLMQEDMGTIRETNAKDVRCVSWILRNITDPEALDAAIRFAGRIRWFEDGMDVEPPYNIIVSIFYSCLDSTGTVYPGLSDRAYHSARAILWIHIRAMCRSEEFASNYPLPHSRNKLSRNLDLNSLLGMYNIVWTPENTAYKSIFTEHNSPEYIRWASNALLHFCWTKQGDTNTFLVIPFCKIPDVPWNTMPLDATLNMFLVWSIFLGCPVEEEMLKIQDKTICSEQVISQLSRAIVEVPPSNPHHPLLRGMLLELTKWDNRPDSLRAIAYEWCSAICGKYPDLEDGEELLFLSLKIAFRGLDFRRRWTPVRLVHAERHQRMVNIVFDSEDDEVIADFLHAWTSNSPSHMPHKSLGVCAEHLIGLNRLQSFSPRLRQLVIRSVELINFQQFEQVGVEEFGVLLDNLNVCVCDVDSRSSWWEFLVYVVRSPEGRRFLPHPYWELMVELVVPRSWAPSDPRDYEREIMVALEEEEQWDALECWSGFVWITRCPKIETIPEDVERVTLSLFRQRPGASQRLEQLLQRSGSSHTPRSLECLRQICERGRLEAALQQDTPSISSAGAEIGEPARSPPSVIPLLVGDDTY